MCPVRGGVWQLSEKAGKDLHRAAGGIEPGWNLFVPG
jgi:hypothetical protein